MRIKMQLLSNAEYEKIRHLFPRNYPNLPFILAIIEHILPGQIWVDHAQKPVCCLVITGGPYCFLAGEITKELLQKCLALLEGKQLIKLVIEPVPLFDVSILGLTSCLRRQYKGIPRELPIYANSNSYLIKKIINHATFDLCQWKPLITDIFGSAENYFKNGLGFIFWDTTHQKVVSEAHGIPSKTLLEIGTITHANYRGQQLSTLLCNHLIRYAIERQLIPVWSCDEDNIGSWKVAEKQGWTHFRHYIFHTLAR